MNWYKKFSLITAQQQQLMFYPWEKSIGNTTLKQQPIIDQSTGEEYYKCLVCGKNFLTSNIGHDNDGEEVWAINPDESTWRKYIYPDIIDQNKLKTELENVYALLRPYYDKVIQEKGEKPQYHYNYNNQIKIPDVKSALDASEEIGKYCYMRNAIAGDRYYYDICYLKSTHHSMFSSSEISEYNLIALFNNDKNNNDILRAIEQSQKREFSVQVEYPVCTECLENADTCESCDKIILDAEQNAYPMQWDTNKYICRECIEDGGSGIDICSKCGLADSQDEMNYLEDEGPICNDCFKEFNDIEYWREQIDIAADQNPYPFAHWFKEYEYEDEYIENPDDEYEVEGRLYIPFVSENQISRDDDKVISFLRERGCQLNNFDYQQGYCFYKGQKTRIGKRILQFRKEDMRNNADFLENASISFSDQEMEELRERNDPADLELNYKNMLKSFETSPYRKLKNTSDIMIAVSQKPDDIAAMSTGRDWTSCMKLGSGSQHHNVFCYIEEGSLIAYAIRRDDDDIKHPLARILIRRFVNEDGISIAVPENDYYGNAPQGFYEFLRDWLETKQRNLPPGLYEMANKAYSETLERQYEKKAKLIAKLMKSGINWYRALKIAERK